MSVTELFLTNSAANSSLVGFGVSVVVVGDFNQLPPLMDKWIFEYDQTNPYANLFQNNLWFKFKYFELTEIMRQKNDVFFADALNKLGEDGVIGLSQEQIANL